MSDHQQGPGWWLASDGKWYPPQGSAQPPVYQQPTYVPVPTNGMAVAALVLGIVAVVFGLIPLFFVVAFGAGLLAVVFGLVGRGKPVRRAMSTWGAALGVVGIGLGVIGVVIVDDAVDDFDEAVSGDDTETLADVEVISCDTERITDSIRYMTAQLRVTNHSSERSGYLIDVVFDSDSDGSQAGSGIGNVNSLAPGQYAEIEATSTDEPPGGGFTCEVTSVDRFASP